jgi:hypothetical protein
VSSRAGRVRGQRLEDCGRTVSRAWRERVAVVTMALRPLDGQRSHPSARRARRTARVALATESEALPPGANRRLRYVHMRGGWSQTSVCHHLQRDPATDYGTSSSQRASTRFGSKAWVQRHAPQRSRRIQIRRTSSGARSQQYRSGYAVPSVRRTIFGCLHKSSMIIRRLSACPATRRPARTSTNSSLAIYITSPAVVYAGRTARKPFLHAAEPGSAFGKGNFMPRAVG